MFRSSNPTLKEGLFTETGMLADGQVMTVQGAVNKTLVLLLLLGAGAAWVWQSIAPLLLQAAESSRTGLAAIASQGSSVALPFAIGGFFVALILGFIISFKPAFSPFLAPVYALAEGMALGGISALIEFRYPGIVMQAVLLTFATLFSLLMAYKTGLIRVTDKFRMGIVAATGAICLIYVINMVMGFFNTSIPFISGNGFFGIAFSVFVVGIAALNLVLDFDLIERGAESGAPKYMEWYGGFALMVTLVWLYIEILNLLMKLRSRD
ncbi:MAG: Bax inhibitor-1/YccA family protein [Candidatus Omnitrophica bacterium]|nr:Bax inhibitor-1/YccA family protein [Candidatus Omnitrophota bacterium]